MAMTLTRLPDWEERLTWFVMGVGRETRFDMGRLSCAIWVADAVKAMTGIDPAPDWRDMPGDEQAIWRYLQERHGDLRAATTAALGPEIPASMAQRGDVVLHVVERGRMALGICNGREFMALADQGIGTRPMHTTICAWRIG